MSSLAHRGGEAEGDAGVAINATAAATSNGSPHSDSALAPTSTPQQRGRKRAASFDACNPTHGGTAPFDENRTGGGGGDGAAVAGEGGLDAVTTPPIAMEIDENSPAKKLVGGGGSGDGGACAGDSGDGDGDGGRLSARTMATVAARNSSQGLLGFSDGGDDREGMVVKHPLPEVPKELRSVGVASNNKRVVGGVKLRTAPPELPLLELEKPSTVDTLFELMESGHNASVLVWDLLMKMPTNMSLYNGFS